MKYPKLIDGLLLLEKEDWLSFRKYATMYCTKSSDNYKLIDYLFSIRHTLQDATQMEQLKNPLFASMSMKSFSNLMSRVFIWFEEWLVWYENKKDTVACDIQLVKIYNRKGVYSLADKTYRRVEKKITSNKQLSLRKHQDLYQLRYNTYFSDNQVKYEKNGAFLEKLIALYVAQFKEQALLYITELHNWRFIQNFDFSQSIDLLNSICTLIDDTDTCSVIDVIRIMVSDLDEDAFLQLRTIIDSGKIDPDSELHVIASLYMIFYSLKLWNHNKLSDSQLVLDAYDFGLSSGLLSNLGKIPIVRYLSFVTTLGYMKTSESSYAVIDKLIPLVDTTNHESLHALGYAQLKFSEKKYEEITPLLLGKKFSTDYGRLRAYSLELISLYEDRNNNMSLLVNRLNNFKRVLKTYRNRKTNDTYLAYWNFAKVLDLLIKRDFIKLTINVEGYSNIIFKKWLMEEIKAGQK